MVLEQENITHLKPWLVRTLEPICDAEPGALADYILALLQHNVPENEMREELKVQLDEFLEKECSAFIDTLFTAIRTKSYLPYNASPASPEDPLDNGIPIPIEILTHAPDRSRKRNSTDDERDGRPPAKTQRLNNDGNFSRYGNNGDGRGGYRQHGDRFMGPGAYAMPMSGMVMNGMNGMGMMNRRPQGYQPPDQKRGFCRDYHNNGFCTRGATCKYSHGEDAMVPNQLYPGMPFMPMFPGPVNGMPFMAGGAYDPHEARMDMRPRFHQRAPLLPREGGSQVINASGELPVIQDLTPAAPPDAPLTEAIPSDDVHMLPPNQVSNGIPQIDKGYALVPPLNEHMYPNSNMEVDDGSHVPGMRPPTRGRGQFRGGRGGRGRGTFGGDVHSFRPEKRNDQTLVVEKIPEDKLSLDSVNDWFKRFGTVTNVAIDPSSAKALISFSNHQEAHAAWKSEEAVFGNRFVKVFWHRPLEGHGQVGARMLAASAPLVANMAVKTAPTAVSTSIPISVSAPSPAAAPSSSTSTSTASEPSKPLLTSTKTATMNALAEKQQRLEKAIAEQKALMASLSTASSEGKKDILAELRKLGDEMKDLISLTTSVSVATTKKPADAKGEVGKKEHERLGKELEIRNEAIEPTEDGETAEELKAKLERLKAEAASLGLDSALPSSSGPYRGYRGRGRGAPRAYYRGGPVLRGGPPRGSMKLDNRPKKLVVKGVPEGNSQALRDWYETTGQLESLESTETTGTYIISFKSRLAAEQGLAKGTNIPIVGSVQISWHTGKEASSSNTTVATTQTSAPSKPAATPGGPTTVVTTGTAEDHVSSEHHEEEVIASGWGTNDDEDGMGLL